MAILRGFPPSNALKPGMPVEITGEVRPSCHKGALIGFASKGPVNAAMSIRTVEELHSSFGYPHPESGESHLIYGAEQALLTLPEVLVVRVIDANLSKTANVSVLDETGEVTLIIHADSPGVEGNDTRVVVMTDERTETFTLNVFNNGVQVESWSQLTKKQNSKYFVESFIELVSDWIRVSNITSKLPQNGIYSLSGGNDGIPTDPNERDVLLAGSKEELTGVYAFSESEQVDIDLIAVPGYSSTQVIASLLDVCESRRDCLAIIDSPIGLSYLESSLWQRGKYENDIHWKSDFAAMFWPWLKIRDRLNRIDVTVPPSGSVMAAIARSDMLSAPWFSPAGEMRGIVSGVLDVSCRLTHEEQNLTKDNRNAVNAIVPFANAEGFMISSQKTLQRGRIDVRRMLFFVEKRIRNAADTLTPSVDMSNESFRKEFAQICERVMGQVKNGGGINDYIIQTNELDTPEQAERNEFRTRIGVQPTNDNKNVYIDFLFR